jgi:hypothetical protein
VPSVASTRAVAWQETASKAFDLFDALREDSLSGLSRDEVMRELRKLNEDLGRQGGGNDRTLGGYRHQPPTASAFGDRLGYAQPLLREGVVADARMRADAQNGQSSSAAGVRALNPLVSPPPGASLVFRVRGRVRRKDAWSCAIAETPA